MKTRWIVLVGVGALVLALTAGLAYAAGRARDGDNRALASRAAWARMHDSPVMLDLHRRMHAQMPEDLRARCQAMFDQMAVMMPGMGSMMSGSGDGMMESGMGSGSGMASGSGHAGHHGS